MSNINKPRGTEDLLFEDTNQWQQLETIIKDIANKYNFSEIRTPIFESTEVFVRGVGETTDVVSKEMYTFSDKSDRSLTLRPEGTAGSMRAYIEHKMFGYVNQPVKLYYMGPMFRYERPQKGRQRQFHQFGVETIGGKSAQIDVECILVGLSICKELGLKNLKVLINTLGDNESRNNYHQELKAYFNNYKDDLCNDCLVRLEKNPLRLLDCKVDSHKDFMINAPLLKDYLNEESAQYFNDVLTLLDNLNIEYEIDNRLVRGLDYYTHTIFEVVSTNKESGSQATLFGGGRYDGLVESLGGPAVSGIGFGMGLERMLISINAENPSFFKQNVLDCYIMPLDSSVNNYALEVLEKIRNRGFKADMDYQNRSLKAMFKYCERNQIKYAVILGEDEMNNKQIILKNLEKQTQEVMSDEWIEILDERMK